MTTAHLHLIAMKKIEQTERDIAEKIDTIRNSALRAEPSVYALQAATSELAALRVRLETLREMAALCAPRED
jgi:hypothetical protein